MYKNILIVILQSRPHSGAESIILGFISVAVILIVRVISIGIKKATAKKNDATKLK